MINANRSDVLNFGVLGGELIAPITDSASQDVGLLDLIEKMGGVSSLGTPEESQFVELIPTSEPPSTPTTLVFQPSLPEVETNAVQSFQFASLDVPSTSFSDVQSATADSLIGQNALVAPVSDDGFSVHLTFDQVTGTTVLDESTGGIDNNGILTNGAQIEDSGSFLGDVVSLAGGNELVAISDSTDINLGTHAQRTLGLWFRADELAPNGGRQVIYEEGAGARGLSIYLDGDRLYVGGWNRPESDWTGTFLSTDAIQSNTWHHVALVLDAQVDVTQPQANAFSAYLDGEQFGVGEGSQLWGHSNDIGLGGQRQGTRFHDGVGSGNDLSLQGDIGDFRLYNRVLTAEEIGAIATQPQPPTELNDVAVLDDAIVHLSLNDGTGTVAADGQLDDGEQSATLQNGAVFEAGFSGGTVSLDGSDDYLSLEDSALINLAEHSKRSIGVWFKLNELSSDGRKQVIYEEGGGGRGLSIYVQNDQLYLGGWNTAEGGWQGTFLSTEAIAAETWHHVMLVLDAEPGLAEAQLDVLTGYLDGVQFGSGDGQQIWPHGSNIGLGATNQDTRFHDGTSRGTGVNALAGAIADFQLYNRALGADDVGVLATRPSIPTGEPELSAVLVEDTGATSADGLTQNPSVIGQVNGFQSGMVVRASLNDQPVVDISDQVLPTGEFSLSEADLAVIFGSGLIDGDYQLALELVDGERVFPTTLSFTLDRSNPTLNLESPLVNGTHGLAARLVGEISDGQAIADATYQLDGGAVEILTTDAEGRFNLPLVVDAGLHQLQVTVTDVAGNQTQQQLDFSASPNSGAIAPAGSQGWRGTTSTSAVLGEGNSLVTEAVLPVTLGQEEGTRTLTFDVQAVFDSTDTEGIQDRLSVYLVNGAGDTLVDMGVAGTPVFALSEAGAEFQAGVVSYNGTTVEIDVSEVVESTEAQLVFQLLNGDGDTGTVVRADQLTNTLDPDGVSNPTFPMDRTVVEPGNAIALDGLMVSDVLEARLSQVRVDAATGTYRADLRVINMGGETLGRTAAIAFTNLPDGVSVIGASEVDDSGNPYFNFQPAIRSGGLAPGAMSDVVELVVENPNFVPLDWEMQVLSAGVNRAPVFEAIDPITIHPGTPFELKLEATDPDGDRVVYSLRTTGALPTGGLRGDGTLTFTPSPDDVGAYTVDVVASDGDLETVQTLTLNVVADAITTTRISGVVQTVEQEALAGVVVAVGEYEAITADDGSFLIEVPQDSQLTDDKLWVLAGDLGGNEAYPSVAEPLELLLGNAPFTGVNNVIDRPIYLPALDIENGAAIDPNATETIEVTTANIPGAKVMVEPGNLENQSGDDFSGILSITEVPIELTPAALPPGLVPDIVVTIQPGEMVFTDPAPLSLPNTSDFGPGVLMDLWSINPSTGEFDKVGVGQVSEDGSVVNTIEGGINNSSWHFFSPAPDDPNVNDGNLGCRTCPKAREKLSSEVELDSGAVIESHDLVTYESLGVSRGVQLRYDSLRADPRPIVQFGYDDVNPNALAPGFTDKLRLVADLTVFGEQTIAGTSQFAQATGYEGEQYGLQGGENFWSIGEQVGPIKASLQVDLRAFESGVYSYIGNSGVRLFVREQLVGSSQAFTGNIIHVNEQESPFGAGWGIAGVQRLVQGPNLSMLLIDGDGSELLFQAEGPLIAPSYRSPAGDFSTLRRLADGTFERTMKDQTVYQFDDKNRLISVTDRNGNQTRHIYEDGLLRKIIDPVGIETNLTYSNGKLTRIQDDLTNRLTLLEYDGAGNLTKITDPDQESRQFEYDKRHLLTAEVDKRGNREETVYDFSGRAVRGIQKDGSVIEVSPSQTRGLFNPELTDSPLEAPMALSETLGVAIYADQDGKVSRTQLDEAGQTVTERDGVGNLGAIVRDDRNLVTQATDARGFSDYFSYDDHGNILNIREEGLASTGVLESRGTSLTFDGVDDYVQLNNAAIIANSSNSTVEAWVKFNSLEGYQLIYSEDDTGGTIYQLALSGGKLAFGNIFRGDPAGQWRIIKAEKDIKVNEWIHVAAVISANEGMKLFIDGNLEASDPISRPSNTAVVSVQAGRANNEGGLGYFNGQIDELRVWNTDRSEAEIQLTLNRRLIAFETDLVGYWNFDSGVGSYVIDQTPNNNDGTLAGGTIWSPDTPQFLTEDFEFDVIYSEDFENGIGSEWSSSLLDSQYTDIFTTYSGRYSNGSQTLTLQTSPGQVYKLEFDLYALDSWDGSASPGPDYFNVWLDDSLAFHETISFIDSLSFRPKDLGGSFGYNSQYSDSVFQNLNLFFQASNSETQIRFSDGGLQGLSDESWGIDNVEISQLNFTNAQFVEQSFTYDPTFSQLTSRIDELGRQTLVEIDPTTGNTLSETRVAGEVGGNDDQITRFTYTDKGQIDRITDPLGRVTDYDYNPLGRLAKITFAQGTADEATQRFRYDTAGNQTLFIDENGNRTQYEYDDLNRLTQVIEADPDGNGPLTSPVIIFTYDENGNLTSVEDARGHLTTYEYDVQDRQTLMTDALLGEMQYEYDNFGNIIAETDERGHTTRYRYDARNRLIETVDPEGAIVQYGYDLDNNLTLIREYISDTEFRDTRYRYDSRNRLIRETDALGETTIYEYDAVNNLTAIEDRNKHRTEYRYDDLDRLIETEDALDQISSQTYDLANNLISATDQLGRTMIYEYDERNRLITTTHPAPFANQSIQYQYDDVGNLRFVTDELDRTTEYIYDGLNREIEMYDPLRHRTAYEYDANDNLMAIEDALGRRTSYLYDKLNRQTARTNALQDTSRTTYDPVGNITAVSDELKRQTTFTYDKRNLLTQVTDPLLHTTRYTYDLFGRNISEENHLGHTTSYEYDDLDRLVEIEDAIGERTTYTYDAEGNQLTLTDAENNTTSYTYDDLDRQISDTTEFGTRTYGYDAVNNQTSYIDRNGRQRSYTYDERNRLTNESWLNAADTPIHQIDYRYNAASELTQISDNHSRYTYQYDDAGRLLEVDNQGTSALPNVILNYSYDDVNNMTGVTDTFNGQTQGQETYTYDALNRVTQLTQQGNNVANKRVDFTYDAASQMTGSTRYANLAGNNPIASSEYSYDLAGRLTDLTHSRGDNTLAFYSWEYDAINRITKSTSIDGTNDYAYNDRDELTATDSSYQDDESYDYDGTGNRTNPGYETGPHNRLLNDGTYSYTYDNEGNRLTRTETATGTIDEYTWDYRNRLTSITTKDSDGDILETAAYTYDAYDRRIEKGVDEDGDGSEGATTEGYVYDGDHIALVFDGDGTLTHRYLHGPQIDQVLAGETVDGEVRWALTDNQGTVRDVIDNQGTILSHITYDSFGQITSQTNAEAYFRFGYTGREYDQESGQYYYRARYFDPGVGRFISEDPIGFNGGDTNVYRYVFNSPLNYTDPSGNVAVTAVVITVVGGYALAQGLFPDPAQAPATLCDIDDTDNSTNRAIVETLFGLGVSAAPGVIQKAPGLLRGAAGLADDTLSTLGKGVFGSGPELIPVPVTGALGEGIESAAPKIFGDITESAAGRAGAGNALSDIINQPLRSQGGTGGQNSNQTGSYTNTHQSGKTYSGKGNRARSQKSGRREARRNNDPHTATDWTPARNNREAFKQESRRIDNHGGVQSSSNYNRIESPGRKFRYEDGEL